MAKPHAIILQKKNMKGEIADQVALMSRSLRSQSKLSLSEISDITIKQDTTLYPKTIWLLIWIQRLNVIS